jgi:hypothetical protein
MMLKKRFLLLTALGCGLASAQSDPKSLVYSGNYQNGAFESLTFVNSVTGWDLFFNSGFRGGSTVIGNIEAGHVWGGHEVFVRAPGVTNGVENYNNTAPGALNEFDFHATMVGHVLAGSGYIPDNGGSYTYAGLGMAPEAKLVSGAIAVEFSNSDVGAFSTTQQSVVGVYKAFFTGSGVDKPDVINSSWGGSDPAANAAESLAIDGLAKQNANVAFVVSAGNGGTDVVGAPGSGYNNISVGSLGGASFLQPSSFSSHGAADFYNPVTNQTITGVRAAVDIAAPGERMFLAAYLGDSGGIGAAIPGMTQTPSPTDQYFLNMDGTSFAAPMVAGGIALMKDAANTLLASEANAQDTRVIKSVLMAGAAETNGWNNGQDAMNVTTQALDLKTGAGAMDLVASADVYYFGTTDVAGAGGGLIDVNGWDSGTISLGNFTDYLFATEFAQEMALTVVLNWFAGRSFDGITDTATDESFANLDLQVWSVDGNGQFVSKVGESMSTYNNTEFLRIHWLAAGRYGLRVTFDDMVYDTTNSVNAESYGLAWRTIAVPEPGSLAMVSIGLLVVLRRKRQRRFVHASVA